MSLLTWSTITGLLCLVVPSSVSFKILLVPMSASSHVACNMAIARELGRRHHETHVLLDEDFEVDRHMVNDANDLNITFVRLMYNRETALGKTTDLIQRVVHLMTRNELPFVDLLVSTSQWADAHARLLLLENEPLIEKLKSYNYDIAVINGFFSTKHFYLLAHRLGIPWITYSDFPDPWMMRVPWLPSIVPGQNSLQSEKMTFLGRISNAWLSYQARVIEHKAKISDHIAKKYQQYGTFDSANELMERSKFWLLTSDVNIDSSKPIMPHTLEVGGLTTKPAKDLPEDIQSFLDGAEDGAIVMSFGSLMSSFPDKLLRKFLEAFRRIERHRIIWRLTNVSEEFQIPDFIRTQSWLQQNDILAHPKVKLFITHCGNNGQFEALYHGVPMLGLPFIADQLYNAIRIENKGYGIGMNVYEFTSDELYTNIMRILNDPSYKRRISLASEIFRSAPQRPAERAAYWIEHIIKFGSDHLQTAGKDLNFFQFYMLDALAMCLAVCILILVFAKTLVSRVLKKTFGVEKNFKLKAT